MLRAITRSLGSLERALMMLSVMPSLKYSMSGLAPALVNGRTASESIALRDERLRLNGDESEVEGPKGRVGLCSESDAGGRSSPVGRSSLVVRTNCEPSLRQNLSVSS